MAEVAVATTNKPTVGASLRLAVASSNGDGRGGMVAGGLPPEALLEPDVLLPSQWMTHFQRAELPPAARLHLAVLEQAVENLRKYAHSQNPKAREILANEVEWVSDIDGRRKSYRLTFRTAVDVVFADFPNVDAEGLSARILRVYRSWDPSHRMTHMKLPYVAPRARTMTVRRPRRCVGL